MERTFYSPLESPKLVAEQTSENVVECSNCSTKYASEWPEQDEPSARVQCPNCGQTGRKRFARFAGSITPTGSVQATFRRDVNIGGVPATAEAAAHPPQFAIQSDRTDAPENPRSAAENQEGSAPRFDPEEQSDDDSHTKIRTVPSSANILDTMTGEGGSPVVSSRLIAINDVRLLVERFLAREPEDMLACASAQAFLGLLDVLTNWVVDHGEQEPDGFLTGILNRIRSAAEHPAARWGANYAVTTALNSVLRAFGVPLV